MITTLTKTDLIFLDVMICIRSGIDDNNLSIECITLFFSLYNYNLCTCNL